MEGGRGLHGAQAEYLRVPLAQSTLVEVPEGCEPEAALFAGDVLATGFFAAELANVGEGTIAVVLGCGPVGLCAVFGALASGAERVFAVDAVAGRLELAERFGAEPAAARRRPPGGGAARRPPGAAPTRCSNVSAAPRPRAWRWTWSGPAAPCGAVGVHTEEGFAFPPSEAYDKNLTYSAGRCPARRYLERLLWGLAERRWDPTPIISHRLPLAAGQDAYRMFAERREGCTKIVFKPGG